ncbi:TetR/AcrR family transcriptional regulator [Actinopolymorpha pittospori]|uniref:Uncharacterized protein n=1 Tax=Actinopolymorpha pittospori TaxID=648752 RepID=A0A927MRE8_9ACTN|nr:TetR/AcrR family transcriptional regulator [Actinopolymorpha pittospori]MBE1603848.1 hypothetical protein [Actinopolymorpha pittospori]
MSGTSYDGIDVVAAGSVVHTYEAQLQSTLAELERRHRSPKARLKALVGVLAERAADSIAQYGAQYGSPYGTLSSELAKQTEGSDLLTATLIQIPLDWAEQQFRALGRRDAHDLAVELIAAHQGSAILTSTLGQPEIMARQTRRIQRWIDALHPLTEPGSATSPAKTGKESHRD